MKHRGKEKRERIRSYLKFIKANPPKMPDDFTHKDYKRVVDYARCAFITGWNSGEIYYRANETEPT